MTCNTPSQGMERNEDLVSVIVPCFNAEKFISATVESVLRQSYRNLELVVVDDKSTDASPRIVKEAADRDERVKLIVADRNHGAPAGPRNIGVRAARGRWVAFLDADDLWHPRKLELQVRALAETSARMCSTQMKDFRSPDPVQFDEPGVVGMQRITLAMQLIKFRTPLSSIVVERNWALNYPFNEDPSFKAREDADCFIRAHEYMDYSIKLKHPFVYYRLQDAQISGNKLKMMRRHLHMLKEYRLKTGESLGIKAYLFTATHFLISVYYRSIKGML